MEAGSAVLHDETVGTRAHRAAQNSGESVKPKGKPRGRPFQPGVSGNPGGRPKTVRETQELAQQHTEEAVNTLVEIMRTCRDPAERRRACVDILNRACGMPTQPVSGSGGRPLEREIPTILKAFTKLAGGE